MSEDCMVISCLQNKKYNDFFPEYPILNGDDRFLQFNAYGVYLPKRITQHIPGSAFQEEALNIFEETVLKIFSVGRMNADDIAEKTCLPADFLRTVIDRMQEQGYIDEQLSLTTEGRGKITVGNGLGNSEYDEEKEEFIILQERDTGNLRPTLYAKNMRIRGELDDKRKITLFSGTAGKRKKVKGEAFVLRDDVGNRNRHCLSKNILQQTLKYFNRQIGYKLHLNELHDIQSTYLGPMFLHVQVVIHRGNVTEDIISDGLTPADFSLVSYVKRKYVNFFKSLRSNMETRSGDENGLEIISVGRNGPYPEIRHLLNNSRSEGMTFDEQQEAAEINNKLVENICKAVEWALLYHIKQYPTQLREKNLAIINGQTEEQNRTMLMQMAAKAGIKGVDKYGSLFSGVRGRALQNTLTSNSPSLLPLLPVAAGWAAVHHDSTFIEALKVLSGSERQGLEVLQRMRIYGNTLRHSSTWNAKKDDTLESLMKWAQAFIQKLLPDYNDDNVMPMTNKLENSSYNVINAELQLQRSLGDEIYYGLDDKLKRQLLLTSKEMSHQATTYDLIIGMSRCMEFLLKPQYVNIQTDYREIKDKLQSKGCKLPGLMQVNPKYYAQACRGENATLGAYALVFLVELGDETFETVYHSGLLELVDKLAGYRKHGNDIMLVLDRDNCLKLWDDVMKMVKLIGGLK